MAPTTGDESAVPVPEVRIERMLPHQVDAAVARRSIVYLPLGSIEYHSHHLPLGLDGLTAHGVCVRAAHRTGGVVLPVLWYGTGGTHTRYPWTIMTPTAEPLSQLLRVALDRLADLGIRRCVLLTGHFADEQLDLVDTLAAEVNAATGGMTVVPLAVNRSDATVPADHAGVFETSLLHALEPRLVELDRLPDLDDTPLDPARAGGWHHRNSPSHPLWGIMGPDPRAADLSRSGLLLDQVVGWVARCAVCETA